MDLSPILLIARYRIRCLLWAGGVEYLVTGCSASSVTRSINQMMKVYVYIYLSQACMMLGSWLIASELAVDGHVALIDMARKLATSISYLLNRPLVKE